MSRYTQEFCYCKAEPRHELFFRKIRKPSHIVKTFLKKLLTMYENFRKILRKSFSSLPRLYIITVCPDTHKSIYSATVYYYSVSRYTQEFCYCKAEPRHELFFRKIRKPSHIVKTFLKKLLTMYENFRKILRKSFSSLPRLYIIQ